MKVLSFCLWGDNPTYLVGAIRNAISATQFYPDFKCWFYIHKETVPSNTIIKLEKMDNVKIIYKSGNLSQMSPMMWRFEAIDDPEVNINISRDLDTEILPREKMAVDEWLESNCLLHIMRDHPYHKSKIMGGMFGIKKSTITWMDKINYFNKNNFHKQNDYGHDQDFLEKIIYPLYTNSCIIHASFNKFEGDKCKEFPIIYDSEYRFVGEYVYHDNTRKQENIDKLVHELKISTGKTRKKNIINIRKRRY